MSSSDDSDTSRDDSYEFDTDRSVVSDPISDASSDIDSDVEVPEQSDLDLNSISFCSTHKPGKMLRTCLSCSVAFKIISDDRIIAKLFSELPASASDLKAKYRGRCDEIVPTMFLSDDVLDIVIDILNKGQFQGGRSTLADITKKYLVLPHHQHKKLSDDLENEEVFNKFKKDSRFRNIFRFQTEIRDCLKSFRLAERPVFSIMDMLNTELNVTRNFGESIGLVYPQIPPARCGVNVPRDSSSRITANSLSFDSKSKAEIFPIPDPGNLFQFLQLDNRKEDAVLDYLENYRSSIQDKVMDFYKSVADTLNNLEDLLVFHFDLWSHCDASMKELLRAKLVSLFKGDVRDAILRSIKSDKDVGLFGGEKKIRSALAGATKSDSVLEKAVIPRRNSRKSRRNDQRRYRVDSRSRSRSPSRSRSRSRSPSSRKRNNKSSKYGSRKTSSRNYFRKRKGNKGNGSSAKKSKSDKS